MSICEMPEVGKAGSDIVEMRVPALSVAPRLGGDFGTFSTDYMAIWTEVVLEEAGTDCEGTVVQNELLQLFGVREDPLKLCIVCEAHISQHQSLEVRKPWQIATGEISPIHLCGI